MSQACSLQFRKKTGRLRKALIPINVVHLTKSIANIRSSHRRLDHVPDSSSNAVQSVTRPFLNIQRHELSTNFRGNCRCITNH